MQNHLLIELLKNIAQKVYIPNLFILLIIKYRGQLPTFAMRDYSGSLFLKNNSCH